MNRFLRHRKKPTTPRMASIMSEYGASIADTNTLDQHLKNGRIPIFGLETWEMYPVEKVFLPSSESLAVWATVPVSKKPILAYIDRSEDGRLNFSVNGIGKTVEPDLESYNELKDIFEALLAISSNTNTSLVEQQAIAKCLLHLKSASKMFGDEFVVENLPMGLDGYMKSIVSIDGYHPNIIEYLNYKMKQTQKDVAPHCISVCKRFLESIKEHPEYGQYKDQIEEWTGSLNQYNPTSKEYNYRMIASIIGFVFMLLG